MRLTKTSLLVVSFLGSFFLFFVTLTAAAPGVIFEDGFTSNDFSQWDSADVGWEVVAGGHDTPFRARISGNSTEAALAKSVSTVGETDLQLTFWHQTVSGWDANDSVRAEWSPDAGGSWQELETMDGDALSSVWVEHVHALPVAAEDNADFAFRFVGNVGGMTDSLSIDDVLLETGAEEVTPTPTEELTPTPTEELTPTPTEELIPTPTEEVTPTPTEEVTSTPTKAPEPSDRWDFFRARLDSIFELMRNRFARVWG